MKQNREMTGPVTTMRPCYFIVSTTRTPCGVEAFARAMTDALQRHAPDGLYENLPVSGRWSDLPSTLRQLAKADQAVFSLPLLAWNRTILLSWVILIFSWIRRQTIFLYLHEWSSLHPIRRLVFFPFMVLSDRILLLSPFIKAQIDSDRWIGWASKKCSMTMHAPTVRRPESSRVTDIVRRVEGLQKGGTIVIGQFGTIYKGKGTDSLLDICANLRKRGVDASIVFIGGTTKSLDGYENEFLGKIKTLGLEDRTIITGYVDAEAELFAIFERVSVFLYIFPEGLTARRSSVLASLQSGKPVVVSAPSGKDEFKHHQGYVSLIDNGAIVLFPPGATTEELADVVVAAAKRPAQGATWVNYDAWWKDAASSANAIMRPARTH
jgi:glycosyltransferase involved in cell wall biosynthesis